MTSSTTRLTYFWLPQGKEAYCSNCENNLGKEDKRAFHRFQRRVFCEPCALEREPALASQPQPLEQVTNWTEGSAAVRPAKKKIAVVNTDLSLVLARLDALDERLGRIEEKVHKTWLKVHQTPGQ